MSRRWAVTLPWVGNRSSSLARVVVAGTVLLIASVASATPALAASPPSGTNCGSQAGGNGFPDCAVPVSSSMAGKPFYSGETIDVTVPANTTFRPGAGIRILECTDPGGLASKDPTNVADCDENTIQGPTVLVNSDGSVKYDQYQVYAIPDKAIGDTDPNPKCDATNWCVLYIGQNQENFSGAPYYMSQPFLVYPTEAGAAAHDSGSSGGSATAPAIAIVLAVIVIAGVVALLYRRRRTTPTRT